MKTLAWLALAVLCLAAPADASILEIADAHLDPRDSRVVHVEFAAGELSVIGTDDDRIHVELTGECEHDRQSCIDQAEPIRIVAQYASDAYHLRLEHTPHLTSNGPKLRLVVSVPRQLAVKVDMKAGDLTMRGLENDVDVDMSAGDVTLDMPEDVVRSVDVHVSVGDASLQKPGADPEAEGWLGKRIRWNRGPGDAVVRIGLAAGDVNVRLK